MLNKSLAMSLRRSSRISSKPISLAANEPGRAVKSKANHTAQSDSITSSRKRPETDVVGDPSSENVKFKKPRLPATPLRKRKEDSGKPPPLTPTPSLVGIIRAPYSTGDVDDVCPPPGDRLVEPHVTNAPLVTPGGTQSVAYPDNDPDSSPSKNGLPRPIATTGTLLDQACAHLIKTDSRLQPLIEKYRCPIFSPEGLAEKIDPFRSLSSGIMGQQVSGAAANAIKNKFIGLFNDDPTRPAIFPTPAQVVAIDFGRLRLAGLSQRKAEYIQGLAQKFVNGELTTDMLMKASDDEVMEKLIAVRGLGKWSVEMFACFGLKRLDILSTGDLGVQRGMAHFFGRDVQKLKAKGGGKWKYMSEQDMLDKSSPFSPYRSLFMWYMWRVEDVDVNVMQNNT